MTKMAWPRFFFFDLLGVIGWGGASVAAGYLAGESWEALAAWLGRASALVVAALLGVAGFLALRRRRRAVLVPARAPEADQAAGSSAVAGQDAGGAAAAGPAEA
jgi:undecaprenyl-diphosphatase